MECLVLAGSSMGSDSDDAEKFGRLSDGIALAMEWLVLRATGKEDGVWASVSRRASPCAVQALQATQRLHCLSACKLRY